MDRMKTFLKYVIWLVLFIVFSEFIINVGLNSSYKDITRKDNISQISVYQAQATLVNGRIRGLATNTAENDLNGKYIRFDIYSKRDVLLGRKYIQVKDLDIGSSQVFEFYFELNEVKSFEVSIVDVKEDDDLELELLPKELTKPQIVFATVLTMLVLW